jgi:hypothetical protein
MLRSWLLAEPRLTLTPSGEAGVVDGLGVFARAVDSLREDGGNELMLLSIFIWITFQLS